MDPLLRAMQTAFVRQCGAVEGPWHRSRIMDFTPELEVVLLLPDLAGVVNGTGAPAGQSGAPASGAQERPEEDAPAAELIYTPGTEIEIEIALLDGLRRFTTAVRRLDFAFGGSMRVKWPTEVRRLQRREHVRVEARFTASVVPAAPTDAANEGEGLVGHTLDISVGGVRLRLPRPLEPESRATIRLAGTPLAGTPLTARVVRCIAPPAAGVRAGPYTQPDSGYQVAFQFIELDGRVRRQLTRFIFELQRELKRRLAD